MRHYPWKAEGRGLRTPSEGMRTLHGLPEGRKATTIVAEACAAVEEALLALAEAVDGAPWGYSVRPTTWPSESATSASWALPSGLNLGMITEPPSSVALASVASMSATLT